LSGGDLALLGTSLDVLGRATPDAPERKPTSELATAPAQSP
jgi:hypothetical protein